MQLICPKCFKSNDVDPKLYFDFIICKRCKAEVCAAGADVLFDDPKEKEVVAGLRKWIDSFPNPLDRMT